ncbi:MAG: branched-chain-amino-acid transaminase [Candidatus Sumerlaeia bacterium]
MSEQANPDLQIYIDGQFYNRENAKVSVFDHTFLYGDGIFEGIRAYEGCIFRLHEHLVRLFESAKYIKLEIPLTLDEIAEAIAETMRRNKLRDCYIRLVVTRGVGSLGLAPWLCKKASIVIIADSITLYPKKYYEEGLSIVTVPTRRNYIESFNARTKSCNYLNNILAKIEGQNAGCIEALMLDQQGYVVECTGDNIFIVRRGKILTPPAYLGALEGITRNAIIEIAREKGYEVLEQPFTRFDVFNAEEAFLTGTAAEALPVIEVDKRPIGNGKPGPITQELIATFRQRVAKDGYQVYP